MRVVDAFFAILFWLTVITLTIGSIVFYLFYEILGLFIRPFFRAFAKAARAVKVYYQNNRRNAIV